MSLRITENELLSALADAGPKAAPHDAMTAAELREALGLNRTTLKKRLRELAEQGRLVVWQTTRADVSGRPQGVPAYTIKPSPKAQSSQKSRTRRTG